MKKIFRFILKSLFAILGILLMGFFVLKLVYNEDLPKGESGEPADQLAYKMLNAISYNKFEEAKEIHWTFRGIHQYKLKVQEHVVNLTWEDYEVIYNTKNPNKNEAFKNNKPILGKEKDEAIKYAIKNYNNDSFWVVAPFKIFDNGTSREIVEIDGKQKLLVTYSSGGTTPGDAYLWELDENYFPIAFKMWVSIIPLDGLEAKWTDWEMTAGGFPLSKTKSVFGIEIPISDLKVIP